jgi:hypothetical protein
MFVGFADKQGRHHRLRRDGSSQGRSRTRGAINRITVPVSEAGHSRQANRRYLSDQGQFKGQKKRFTAESSQQDFVDSAATAANASNAEKREP